MYWISTQIRKAQAVRLGHKSFAMTKILISVAFLKMLSVPSIINRSSFTSDLRTEQTIEQSSINYMRRERTIEDSGDTMWTIANELVLDLCY